MQGLHRYIGVSFSGDVEGAQADNTGTSSSYVDYVSTARKHLDKAARIQAQKASNQGMMSRSTAAVRMREMLGHLDVLYGVFSKKVPGFGTRIACHVKDVEFLMAYQFTCLFCAWII